MTLYFFLRILLLGASFLLLSACMSSASMERYRASVQPVAPFTVKADLFDYSQPESLSLAVAKGTESFTVYSAKAGSSQYNHGAVLIEFNGRLYTQWQSSAKDEDAPDTHVLYSVSDNGEQWSEAHELIKARDNAVVTNGGWWSDGKTLVAYINVWPNSLKPRGGYVEFITSNDGKVWSTPQRVTMADGSAVNGVIEQDLRALSNGRIVTTVHEQPGLRATPYYTDAPLGTTGWRAGELANLPYDGDVSRELEPSWYVKRDGNVVMIFRDQGGSFRTLAAQSSDNAASWSTVTITDLPDSRAKQSAGNLPDGTAFIVNNPSGSKARFPLAVTLSNDGNLFDRAFLLRGADSLPPLKFSGKYKRLGFSYPKSIVTGDYLYVSYAVNKENITVTRVPVSSLQFP